MSKTINKVIPIQQVESLIYLIRGQKVMIDSDLAALYGVETRILNQAVQRNQDRFPSDFMFQLSEEELEHTLRSQIVISKQGRGGRRFRPYAFTEQGIAMLSSVLRSPRAVQVNIEIMRAFVKIRQWLSTNAELSQRLSTLEKKYDAQFKVVFDAIRMLVETPAEAAQSQEIGFHTAKPKSTNSRSKAVSRI